MPANRTRTVSEADFIKSFCVEPGIFVGCKNNLLELQELSRMTVIRISRVPAEDLIFIFFSLSSSALSVFKWSSLSLSLRRLSPAQVTLGLVFHYGLMKSAIGIHLDMCG